MFSLKPKILTDEELVEKLRIILNECDETDYKTKKFVGLLYDYIPYQTGLKTRLEIIAKSGYLEQLNKLSKSSSPANRIEKLAVQFSNTYGFLPEESFKSFQIFARAFNMKMPTSDSVKLKIVQAAQSGQGNFSKKHLTDERSVKPEIELQPNPQPLHAKKTNQNFTYKKKWVRNKQNLLKYLFFIVALPSAFIVLLNYFGQIPTVVEYVNNTINSPSYNSWVAGIAGATAALVLIPILMHKFFKAKVLSLYPLVMILIQLILAAIKPQMPYVFEMIQIALVLSTILSFAVLTLFTVRLPKGAKDFISYKAMNAYYVMGVVFLISQYFIRTSI